MPLTQIHPDYIVHNGKKTKVVLDIREYEKMRQELERVEEYEEALYLSKDAEFIRLVQQSLSSPSMLRDKTAEEMLNEI